MLVCGPSSPPLDVIVLDLHSEPTRTAHQMVVVDLRGATSIDGLAILPAHGIDHSGFVERLEGSVHRRKPELVTRGSQLVV
jgi:hypothetical protein